MSEDSKPTTSPALTDLGERIREVRSAIERLNASMGFPDPSKRPRTWQRLTYHLMRPFRLLSRERGRLSDELIAKQIALAESCERLLTEHDRRLDWTLEQVQRHEATLTGSIDTLTKSLTEMTTQNAAHKNRLDWTLGELIKLSKDNANHTNRLDWTLDELKKLAARNAEQATATEQIKQDIDCLSKDLKDAAVEVERQKQLYVQIPEALTTRVSMVEKAQQQADTQADNLRRSLSDLNARLSELIDKVHLTDSYPAIPKTEVPPAEKQNDINFYEWETETRGTEAGIMSQQQAYIDRFADAPAPILDAGCGRGEFLEILKSRGIDAWGIDSDAPMVEHCHLKGLDVKLGDLVPFIFEQPDESLGGVFMGHVIEHLPTDVLLSLIPAIYRKLKPGAVFIAETPNPTCLTMFSGAFYADITHIKPIHPKAAEFLCRSAGFTDVTIIPSAPVPPSEALQTLAETEPIAPVLKDVILQMNKNIDHLNALLFSYGNYAIAGRKPTAVKQ